MNTITIETATFTMTVGEDAQVRSLVIKATGAECIAPGHEIPLFASTQRRPFNNEIKLAWPNKRTTYPANRLRREGDLLTIGFAIAPYEALVRVREAKGYAAFTLEGWICPPDAAHYRNLKLDVPPVAEFRLLQLPVANRRNFGVWLNVSWDDDAAVAVVAAEPLVEIDSDPLPGARVLHATLASGRRLVGGTAAIVAGGGEAAFLDAMEELEEDYGLPRGVASRRSDRINASIYWTWNMTPETVDWHIEQARRGGFRMMLIYYTAFFKTHRGYDTLGDYDWRDEYPEGPETLRKLLAKIKAAGITPGFHTLQTHIGMASRYVTPVADPRLGKTRLFTLRQALPPSGEVSEIEVEETTLNAPLHDGIRVLQFGGELFEYEGYTSTPPYRFTGVKRGFCGTLPQGHPQGVIGGTLDVSEFGGTSCYINQNTDLQDEIADKIAKVCDAGMEFCYFDGSEGVNAPCGVNVALSQYRVVSKFATPPLFTEGAAKSHFGWHVQAGANAFDVFGPAAFKAKIVEFPLAEASLMRQDFTRLDFGWWRIYVPDDKAAEDVKIGTQPDMWEFGTSRAAAWDCPATIQMEPAFVKAHPRMDDLFEVMRRWEDVRRTGWLTPEQKLALRSPTQEHHLLVNGKGDYELAECDIVEGAAQGDYHLRAFVCRRADPSLPALVTYWHTAGEATALLPKTVAADDIELCATPDGPAMELPVDSDGRIALPVGNRLYLRSRHAAEFLVDALKMAELQAK